MKDHSFPKFAITFSSTSIQQGNFKLHIQKLVSISTVIFLILFILLHGFIGTHFFFLCKENILLLEFHVYEDFFFFFFTSSPYWNSAISLINSISLGLFYFTITKTPNPNDLISSFHPYATHYKEEMMRPLLQSGFLHSYQFPSHRKGFLFIFFLLYGLQSRLTVTLP